MTKYDIQYQLISILQHYAPDKETQELVVTLTHNASRHGASIDDIIHMLAGFLIDGLHHGNWPWIK